LETPRASYSFPGLKPGDKWCLCADRWLEAAHAGVAPPVVLAACNAAALGVVPRDLLLAHKHEPLPAAETVELSRISAAAEALIVQGNVGGQRQ
jgi:hypothetical protein